MSVNPATWIEIQALDLRSGLIAVLLVVALVGTSGWFLPAKVSGSAVSDTTYETAAWIAEYADEQNMDYPENYVFSRWGINRPLNYPVNGMSSSYGYAAANYPDFIASNDPEAWYERLHNRIGFVVLEPLPRHRNTIQQHLYVTWGSRWDGYEAVSHYRGVYATENNDNRVFVLVPGATVTGTAPVNTTVEVRTTVDIPNDSFLYRQQATTNATGQFEAVVPYPGEYEVRVNNETRTVTVPERAVQNGTKVRVGE